MIFAVAPLAGAWIEIFTATQAGQAMESLLSQERGLKCNNVNSGNISSAVAPLAGAWIEIDGYGHCVDLCASLLSQERGLK